MNTSIKKTLRTGAVVIASLIILLTGSIALLINFIFTPEKLTPMVLKAANQNMNAQLDMDGV